MTPELKLVKDEIYKIPEIISLLDAYEMQCFEITRQSYLCYLLLKNYPNQYAYHFASSELAYFSILGRQLGLLSTHFSIDSTSSAAIGEITSLVQKSETIHMQATIGLITSGPAVNTHPPSPLNGISVIVPTKDRKDYLIQCLKSLSQQENAPDFEVLIGWDGWLKEIVADQHNAIGEAENFEKEMQSIAPNMQMRFFYFKQQGASKTRNALVQNARFDHLVFVDDDNLAQPAMLKNFSLITSQCHFDILVAPHEIFFDDCFAHPKKRIWVPLAGPIELSTYHNVLGDMNMCLSRQLFNSLNGIDDKFDLACEDWELLLRALMAGHRIGVIPEPSQKYRAHPSSFYKRAPKVLSETRILAARAKQLGLSSTLDLELERDDWLI